MISHTDHEAFEITASDHLDPDGSIVKSGIILADAAVKALEEHGRVRISLRGLKGASSSYFNVFLRRMEEQCGLAVVGDNVLLEFGSKVQEMVFERSFDSLKRGPRKPSGETSRPVAEPAKQRLWKRIIGALLHFR
jgi:hypothetical protein